MLGSKLRARQVFCTELQPYPSSIEFKGYRTFCSLHYNNYFLTQRLLNCFYFFFLLQTIWQIKLTHRLCKDTVSIEKGQGWSMGPIACRPSQESRAVGKAL